MAFFKSKKFKIKISDKISPQELQSILKRFNVNLSPEEFQKLLREGKLEKKIERRFTFRGKGMSAISESMEESFRNGKLIKRKFERKEISLARLIFIAIGILIIVILFVYEVFLKGK
jgi:hypothetical protein